MDKWTSILNNDQWIKILIYLLVFAIFGGLTYWRWRANKNRIQRQKEETWAQNGRHHERGNRY